MRFSDIVSKRIVCLGKAKELGMVLSITVDDKLRRVKQLITADQDEEDGYLALRYAHFGKDVIFTVNKELDYQKSGITCPIRRDVYDTDGNGYGSLSDIEFDGKEITSLILDDNATLSPLNVVLASEKMIIIKGERQIRPKKVSQTNVDINNAFNIQNISEDNGSKIREETDNVINENANDADSNDIKSNSVVDNEYEFTEEIDEAERANETPIADTDERSNQEREAREVQQDPLKEENKRESTLRIKELFPEPKSSSRPEKPEPPSKIIYGYEFLLGRKVSKDVYHQGTLIADKGKEIDVATVEKAGKAGKLVELTVNSER